MRNFQFKRSLKLPRIVPGKWLLDFEFYLAGFEQFTFSVKVHLEVKPIGWHLFEFELNWSNDRPCLFSCWHEFMIFESFLFSSIFFSSNFNKNRLTHRLLRVLFTYNLHRCVEEHLLIEFFTQFDLSSFSILITWGFNRARINCYAT